MCGTDDRAVLAAPVAFGNADDVRVAGLSSSAAARPDRGRGRSASRSPSPAGADELLKSLPASYRSPRRSFGIEDMQTAGASSERLSSACGGRRRCFSLEAPIGCVGSPKSGGPRSTQGVLSSKQPYMDLSPRQASPSEGGAPWSAQSPPPMSRRRCMSSCLELQQSGGVASPKPYRDLSPRQASPSQVVAWSASSPPPRRRPLQSCQEPQPAAGVGSPRPRYRDASPVEAAPVQVVAPWLAHSPPPVSRRKSCQAHVGSPSVSVDVMTRRRQVVGYPVPADPQSPPTTSDKAQNQASLDMYGVQTIESTFKRGPGMFSPRLSGEAHGDQACSGTRSTTRRLPSSASDAFSPGAGQVGRHKPRMNMQTIREVVSADIATSRRDDVIVTARVCDDSDPRTVPAVKTGRMSSRATHYKLGRSEVVAATQKMHWNSDTPKSEASTGPPSEIGSGRTEVNFLAWSP